MLPPPPSSPYWKDVEDKQDKQDRRRKDSVGLRRSPFRDSLASKERMYQQERQRVSRSTDYKAELNRLLSKATGTPYEETLRKLIEGKNSSSNGNVSEMSLVVDSEMGHSERSLGKLTTPEPGQGLPPRSPPRNSQQSRVTELDQSAIRRDAPQVYQAPVVARASPTREMAQSAVKVMASRRDELVRDTDNLKKEAIAIRTRKESDKKEWYENLSKPKERYGWEFESEYRKQNSLIRTTTNLLGRQRPPPDVRSVDMIAHTARGNVNLFDYHESMKDFVKLGTANSTMYDPNQHLVQQLAREKKTITAGQFRVWLEETQRWRESITKKAEEKLREQTPSFHPTRFTKDESVILRARERESEYLEQELLESEGLLRGARRHRARSASPAMRGGRARSRMESRRDELRYQREELLGEEGEEGESEGLQDRQWTEEEPKGDSPTTRSQPGETSSLVYSSPDSAAPDAFEQEKDEKRQHYADVAEKVAHTPDVFKRMSARIEAYNQRAHAEKELQEAVDRDINNSVHHSEERIKLLALRERRRRSKSPTLTDSRRGRDRRGRDLSFTPEMNRKSASIVKRLQREGSYTPVSERGRRSASMPPRIQSPIPNPANPKTAQERVLSFLDSVGNPTATLSPAPSPRPWIQMPGSAGSGGTPSNQHDEVAGADSPSPRGRSKRRKTFVFEKSLRTEVSRPSSLPPRPRFGVRSISSEAVIDRYDTIDTKARRAQKREQRVLEAYERSMSPKLIGSRVNINSRRYTMASPPKASRFATTPNKFSDRQESRIDGITRRLSVLYERRKSLESGGVAESVFSRSRAGDSSDEEEKMVGRRKSITHRMNQKHYARSRFRGQSFEERTEESVEEFIIRRGVSDALALCGASPGPGHYNVSPDTKSYFSNCNKIVGGEAVDARTTAGKRGYKFGNRSMRKMSYYGPIEVKGVAYKLTDEDDVRGEPSHKSSGDRLPEAISDSRPEVMQ